MNIGEISKLTLRQRWYAIDDIVYKTRTGEIQAEDIRGNIAVLDELRNHPLLSLHPKRQQLDLIVEQQNIAQVGREDWLDVHSGDLKPIENEGKSYLNGHIHPGDINITKEILKESLNKILASIGREPEEAKYQTLSEYFDWMLRHYDSTGLEEDRSVRGCYGPEIVQAQMYAEEKDFYREISDTLLVNAEAYIDDSAQKYWSFDSSPWSCHSGARGRIWQLFGQIKLSLDNTSSYIKEVSNYVNAYSTVGVMEKGEFSWKTSMLLAQKLSQTIQQSDFDAKERQVYLTQALFMSCYEETGENNDKDQTILKKKDTLPDSIPEELKAKFTNWPDQATKNDLVRFQMRRDESLQYSVSENKLSTVAINRLTQKIYDAVYDDFKPLSQSWLFECGFYDPEDGQDHSHLYYRIKDWLEGTAIDQYADVVTSRVRDLTLANPEYEKIKPALLTREEVHAENKSKISTMLDEIKQQIESEFSTVLLCHLYKDAELRENIDQTIETLLMSSTPPSESERAFQRSDIDSLAAPIQSAHRKIVEFCMQPDKPEEYVLFLTNPDEIAEVRNQATAEHFALELPNLVIEFPDVLPSLAPQDLALQDANGHTILHFASVKGHTEIAKLLIAAMRPEDLAFLNRWGETAMYRASEKGHTDIVKLLIPAMRPKDLAFTDFVGRTALHQAAASGHTEIVKLLLPAMRQEDLVLKDRWGRTALHTALDEGDTELAKLLIPAMGQEGLALQNGDSDTALHLASEEGHTEIVKLLIDEMRPEDLALRNGYGHTALHLALQAGHTEIAKLLITAMRQEDLALPDRWGRTALHTALDEGDTELAKLLIPAMRPEDLAFPNKGECTALHLASGMGNTEIVQLLIPAMRPEGLALPNRYGDTALHRALRNGHTEIAKLLIAAMKKEDLVLRDGDGNRALYRALRKGHTEVAKLLIPTMRQEDLALRDSRGKTALHLASEDGHTEIAKLLIPTMRQEDLGLTNKDGKTALDLAVAKNNTEVAELLREAMNKKESKNIVAGEHSPLPSSTVGESAAKEASPAADHQLRANPDMNAGGEGVTIAGNKSSKEGK